jgi:hypothetical protein
MTAKPKRTVVQAFDEWMRRFVEEPERFAREFQSVSEFVAEGGQNGAETSYGRECAAYLEQLMAGE